MVSRLLRVHIRNKHFTWLHNIFAAVFRYWLSALLAMLKLKFGSEFGVKSTFNFNELGGKAKQV